jgi:hypothetical protein
MIYEDSKTIRIKHIGFGEKDGRIRAVASMPSRGRGNF